MSLEDRINVAAMQITDKVGAGLKFPDAVIETELDLGILGVPDVEFLIHHAAQWLILGSVYGETDDE